MPSSKYPHFNSSSLSPSILVLADRRNAGIPHARRIEFDDLHDTGIYSWDYLHHLGSNKFALMKQYRHFYPHTTDDASSCFSTTTS